MATVYFSQEKPDDETLNFEMQKGTDESINGVKDSKTEDSKEDNESDYAQVI